MVETLIIRRMVIFITVLIMLINILLYIGDIHDGILPKFISSSFKENLKLEFNSIFLNRIFKILNKFIKINNSTTSFLIGDLPIYPNSSDLYINPNYTNDDILIENIRKDLKFTDKIPVETNSKYFLFPNCNKTKINIVIFSLEKIKDVNNENIIFPKLSQISLYEIPIHNFIINYQSEFDLKKSFFKLKWKIDLPGIISKHSFSNDYEQLCVVIKNITNNKEIRYNIAYIDINNKNNLYDIIELEGNLKIESIAVINNIIAYSRKYDLYKLNFLIKDQDSNKWINLSKMKINPFKEPYNKIDRLKFISKNNNNTNNETNKTSNDIYLFMKGIHSNEKGVFLYMKFLTLDLNLLNYKLILNENLDSLKNDIKSHIIYIKDNNEHKNKEIMKDSIIFYNQSIFPSLFDRKKLSLFDKNYTYNMDNLELDKLSLNFKDIHSYTIFNKYLQKKDDQNFLLFHYLSNINAYSTFVMNSSFFNDIKSNDYNEDEFIIKTDQNYITKICGQDDNYIIELNEDRLFYTTKIKPLKNNQQGDIIETRRISFLSVPNGFKPKKIHDFYFDFFDNKYILILLIDDGVMLSLDFTKSIEKKNNSAVFYMDIVSNKKIIMITINFFFLFLYSLDWSHFDQISINIRNMIVNFINSLDNQMIIENNFPNRFDERELNLSNSSLSLLSNASNDLNEEINNNNLYNMELNENGRLLRSQRSVIEDLLGVFPY